MNNPVDQQPFPVDAFPPIAYNAIMEVQRNTQTPFPMIASSMLGALSLAIQSKVDVCRMDGLTGPCSLFVLTIAESGERKTTIDKLFTKPIRDFEASQAIAMKPELEKYRAEKAAWIEKRKGILLAIRANAKQGEKADENDLEQALKELETNEPIEPKVPLMIITDATPEAIAYDLYKKWPSAGIMSDEGAVVFGGRATHNLGMLNKLWDGDPLHVKRKTTESFIVKDARLTISIMVQPKTFDNYLCKQGSLARDNGNQARFLVSQPYSTQGTRFIQNTNPSWLNLIAFQNRLSEILNSTKLEASQSPPDRTMLKFLPEAQLRWMNFYNRVEADLITGGYLEDVKDGASKIGDNLARIAALLHYFEGNEGDISLATMNRAVAICEWYLHEFKRLFASAPEVPIEILDAETLETWLVNFIRRYPWGGEIRKNVIAQLGPNQLRANKLRREAALYVLSTQDKIRQVQRGKTKLVLLNPVFFPITQPQHGQYQQHVLLPH